MPGGAGGSIQAMIQSLKFNKSQLTKRKSYKDIKELYNSAYKKRNLSYKKADSAYLKTIREEVIKDQKREYIKRLLIIGISLILAFVLVLVFLFSMNISSFTANKNDLEHYSEKLKKEKNQAFFMFVNYGDNHLSHHEYTLAINNYESALQINPDNIHVKHKLSTILCISCLDSNLYCSEAINALTDIIAKTDTAIYALERRIEVYMHLGEYEKAEVDLLVLDNLK